MTIKKQRLYKALSTIHEDEEGCYYCGQFVNICSDLHINFHMGMSSGNLPRCIEDLYNQFTWIDWDICRIETILLRLVWQKDLWLHEKIDDVLWIEFGSCDIDLFYVKYRAIFDHIAKIIQCISDKPGQVPGNSFRELRNWIEKEEGNNSLKVGRELAELLKSCDWFHDLRAVRDSIIHRGGRTILFPHREKILFQVDEQFKNKICMQEIMFNNYIVDFELYSGIYMGYLLFFLEEMAEVTYKRSNICRNSFGNARSYHAGLRLIRNWIEKAISV